MGLGLIEGAVDAIKDYLDTNFPAKVTALNTEYNDGITITDMQTWYVALPASIAGYPVCIFQGKDGRPEQEGNGYMKSEHTVEILFIETDQNVETLQRKLFRYIRAAVELIKDSRDSIGYGINIGDWNFIDEYDPESYTISSAKITVYPKKYETL